MEGSQPLPSDDHPGLEDLAAFIDGRLSAAEKSYVTQHLAGCETCYEVVSGTLRLQDELRTGSSSEGRLLRFPFRGSATRLRDLGRVAAAALVIVALGVAVQRSMGGQSQV